jgi:diguanylate cyclase (GGDEF)-like protein
LVPGKRIDQQRIAWGARWLAALALLLVPHAPAIATELIGAPPIERFSPNIDLYPQNFCVVQEQSGRVLICGTEGLVEFDSERWRLTRMPNGEILRSMAIAHDGVVYLGGYNFFGLMRRDAAGVPVIDDLTAKFKSFVGEREFADIWEVLITDEGVYFRALHDLFLWNPVDQSTRHWYHAGRFGWLSRFNGNTVVQFRGEGIKARDGAGWKPIERLARFKTMMRLWAPLSTERALIIDDGGQWFIVERDATVVARPMPRGFDAKDMPFRALLLPDGQVAFGTNRGDILVANESLESAHRLMRGTGFITGLALQRGGGLLASESGDLIRIGWPMTWSVLGEFHGVQGNFTSLVEWNGVAHLVTTGAIYRAEGTTTDLKFRALPANIDIPYDLFPLDSRRALVADSRRISLLEHERTRDITDEKVYPRGFKRSHFHPGLVFVFTEHGLRTIEPDKTLAVSAAMPQKLGVHITTLVETNAREAWAGTERHGVIRYRLGANGKLEAADFFDASHGLSLGQVPAAYVSTVNARRADGQVDWVVSANGGEFRWNGTRFEPASLGNFAALRSADETFTFVQRAHGDLWAYSSLRIFSRDAGKAEWRAQEIRPLRRGALVRHVELANGQLAFVNFKGLLIHRPRERPPADSNPSNVDTPTAGVSTPPPTLLLTGVYLDRDGQRTALPLKPQSRSEFAQGDFSLHFEFALPEYVREGIKRYQGRLDGEEERFSDWSPASRYTYSVLKPRDYTMYIRAADSEGRESELPPYRFTVLPPWYARFWARSLFALMALGMFAWAVRGFIRVRTRRVLAANAQLEARIVERTRELAEANRRLDQIAHLDGLTGIANRRSLDEQMPNLWRQCGAQGRPLSVLLIDADHFKAYNDRHGHVAGDDLLRSLARIFIAQLRRTSDFLARYGGEEFLVAMPGADAEVATDIAESMRLAVADSTLGVTISIGVCTEVPNGGSPQALVERADRALYRAKEQGRNRVIRCDAPD